MCVCVWSVYVGVECICGCVWSVWVWSVYGVCVCGVCMCEYECVCIVCGCIAVCMCVVHACSVAPRLHMKNSAVKDILVLQTAAPCIPSLRGSSSQKAVRDDVCGNVSIDVYSHHLQT